MQALDLTIVTDTEGAGEGLTALHPLLSRLIHATLGEWEGITHEVVIMMEEEADTEVGEGDTRGVMGMVVLIEAGEAMEAEEEGDKVVMEMEEAMTTVVDMVEEAEEVTEGVIQVTES